MTRIGPWPPGPVYRSLLGTLLVLFRFALGVSMAVGGTIDIEIPINSVASVLWRAGFVFSLLWVELRRQSISMFLINLGVSRRRTLASLGVAYGVLEVGVLLAVFLARAA